jgi:hypothetical protein
VHWHATGTLSTMVAGGTPLQPPSQAHTACPEVGGNRPRFQALPVRMQTPYARRLHLPGLHLAALAPHGYEARFVYMLTRHGTRYPTRKWFDSFQQLAPLLQVRCRSALRWGRLACLLRLGFRRGSGCSAVRALAPKRSKQSAALASLPDVSVTWHLVFVTLCLQESLSSRCTCLCWLPDSKRKRAQAANISRHPWLQSWPWEPPGPASEVHPLAGQLHQRGALEQTLLGHRGASLCSQ